MNLLRLTATEKANLATFTANLTTAAAVKVNESTANKIHLEAVDVDSLMMAIAHDESDSLLSVLSKLDAMSINLRAA